MSNTVNPNLISLISIRTIKGSIGMGDVEIVPPSKVYAFTFRIDLAIEREKRLLKFVLEVNINNTDNNKKPIDQVGSFTTEFIFHIGNLEELVEFIDPGKHANLNGALSVTITSIAYSTMRGIINTRTQGTNLNGIILPVIDPVDLVNNTIASKNYQVSQKIAI